MEQSNPPYVSFSSFLSALAHVAQRGIPELLTSDFLDGDGSSTNTSHLLIAFRTFGLTDRQNKPTAAVRELIEHPERHQEIFRQLFMSAYDPIFSVAADLSSVSFSYLTHLFATAYTLKGETLRRAIVFFIKAAEHAGVSLSPELAARTSKGNTHSMPARVRDNACHVVEGVHGENRDDTGETPEGTSDPLPSDVKTLRFADGSRVTISVSLNIFAVSKEDREFVLGLIDKVNGYEHSLTTTSRGDLLPDTSADQEETKM